MNKPLKKQIPRVDPSTLLWTGPADTLQARTRRAAGAAEDSPDDGGSRPYALGRSSVQPFGASVSNEPAAPGTTASKNARGDFYPSGETMKPKQFLGRDMTEALRAVRNSLGPDALILQSRSVAGEHGAGVEVIAMNEESKEIRRQPPARQEPAGALQTAGALEDVREDIAEVRSLLRWLLPTIAGKGVVEKLLDQGLSPEIIARLAREMDKSDQTDERERMFGALARLLPCGGDLEHDKEKQGRAVLVGPTGVGKTTSLIKLTVRLAGQQERRVGWISLESRRSVGGDLLANYCGILGVPYRAAEDRDSLARAFSELSECDWVLVDTPGMSPRDEEGLEELADALEAVPDLKRILLLSATTNGRDMAAWVERYRKLGFDSLTFTKIDECRYFGPLINTAIDCGRPLSYVTVGQDLVNDLQTSRPDLLSSLLLTGWSNDD
jgi:flagellar biosynthesis protein FlhF